MRAIIPILFVVVTGAAEAMAAPPTQLSFQGYLTDLSGTPITGSPSLTFKIYLAPSGGPAIWSETIPSLPVNAGIFNAVLGLISPLNLNFEQPYYLGITVGTDPEIVPRARLTASPYTFNVVDGAVVKSVNGLKDHVRIVGGPNVSVFAEGDSVAIAASGGGSSGWAVVGNDVHSIVPGNVGIGTAQPVRPLHIRGSEASLRVDRNLTGGGLGIILNRYDATTPVSWRTFALGVDAVGPGDGSFFIADLDTATAGVGVHRLVLDNQGRLGVGVGAPAHQLDVDGDLRAHTSPNLGLLVHGNSPNVLLDLVKEGPFAAASARIRFGGDGSPGDTSGEITFHTRTASSSLMERMRIGNAGVISIYERDGANRTIEMDGGTAADLGGHLDLYGSDGSSLTARMRGYNGSGGGGGLVNLYDEGGHRTVSLVGQEDAMGGAQLGLWDSDGTTQTIVLDAKSPGNGDAGVIRLRDAAGTSRVEIFADWSNSGNGRVVTDVLEINGGSDLSERFDVRPADGRGASGSSEADPGPGSVVRISSDVPGGLVVSDREYDLRVAGVISGAGGVSPGMVMGQNAPLVDGSHPVALSGRVYCLADASVAPIEPGDLLTTSGVPGHAMKVRDYDRARGAILGKALTSLSSGRGLVLVLVSLQ